MNTDDVVRFGVDIMSHKEKHGSIVALLKLSSLDSLDNEGIKTDELMIQSIQEGDLYRLNSHVAETLKRDYNLEASMLNLRKIIESTRYVWS